MLKETTKKYYRVDRKNISFIKFIFEGNEGIAVLSTVDPVKGIIVFHIAPGCEKDVDIILNDLKKDIMIRNISPDPYTGL